MHKKNAEKNGQKSWFHAEEFHKQRALIEKNLKTEIFEALKSRPELDVSHLRVHVRGSVVTLEGTVENAQEARAMKKIVENIPGVSEVLNHLAGTRGIEL